MLPDIIEIVPPSSRTDATVVLPGSKSLTNRALILAALASSPVVLRGALWSEDTQAMVNCLKRLGFCIEVADDPAEPANRIVTVYGCGGRIPNAGTPAQPLELFVENAGTAARFLPPFLCLSQGVYRVSGVPRMHERPQASLIHALRELGYRIDSANDRLPAVIHGTGPRHGATCSVSAEESSQFASALLLSERIGGWKVRVTGGNENEQPYVDMTRRLVNDFPWDGGVYDVEPDASGASYFWGAHWLLRDSGSRVTVMPAPASGMQVDQKFCHLMLEQAWPPVLSRSTDLADSIMTAIVLAPFAPSATLFIDLGRLRVQECERVEALRTELTKCGAHVGEIRDSLRIDPGPLRGAEIETYGDHRIAMCFGMLGLRVPSTTVKTRREARLESAWAREELLRALSETDRALAREPQQQRQPQQQLIERMEPAAGLRAFQSRPLEGTAALINGAPDCRPIGLGGSSFNDVQIAEGRLPLNAAEVFICDYQRNRYSI